MESAHKICEGKNQNNSDVKLKSRFVILSRERGTTKLLHSNYDSFYS